MEHCVGRLIVKEGIITKGKSGHNHAPDVSAAKIRISMSKMKDEIVQSRECTSTVINRHMESVSREFRPYFPTENTMRRILQKARRKEQPALPKCLADLQIQGETLMLNISAPN